MQKERKKNIGYMFDNSMFDDLNDFDWRENKSYDT